MQLFQALQHLTMHGLAFNERKLQTIQKCPQTSEKLGWISTFSGSQQLHLPDQRLRSAYASDRKFLSDCRTTQEPSHLIFNRLHNAGMCMHVQPYPLELGLKQMNSPFPLPACTCKLPHSTAILDLSPSECMLA